MIKGVCKLAHYAVLFDQPDKPGLLVESLLLPIQCLVPSIFQSE